MPLESIEEAEDHTAQISDTRGSETSPMFNTL